MEAFRYSGRLPAAVAGVLGLALAMSAMPASAAERGGGDYVMTSACLSIRDESIAEGSLADGKSVMYLEVTPGKAPASTVTVDYITSDFTAKVGAEPGPPTGTFGEDYQFASGTLTFPAGSTLPQYIPVNINGDDNFEGNETFRVTLSNVSANATICDALAFGTILEDQSTATLLSQFAVEAVEEGIALRWQFGEPSSIKSSWVERADAQTGPWATVDAEVLTEDGMLTMVDRSVEAGRTYHYRLAATLTDGQKLQSGSIAATTGEVVREFALSRISPNPTNRLARIDYAVPQQSKVRLSVLDVQGRVVAVLVDGVVKAGRHQAVWSGESASGKAPAGMYFVRYEAGGRSFVKRVALTQ